MPDCFDLGRDVLAARGPDAAAYLQGQLSQDVAGLAEGASAWSWLLAPAGKVDALLRVWRLGAEDWLIDVDGGFGPVVLERLQRFRLRTRVDLEPAGLHVVRWVPAPAFPAATQAATQAADGPAPVAEARPAWPGLDGLDTVGAAVPAGAGRPEDYEPWRILAGIPRMGAELDERTIPAEAGITAWTVSFTKGCYTGQELVARVDSRGNNVPRRLAGLRSTTALDVGAELTTPDGGPAGVVTSAAAAPDGRGWVALGWIRRAAAGVATLRAGGTEVRRADLPGG